MMTREGKRITKLCEICKEDFYPEYKRQIYCADCKGKLCHGATSFERDFGIRKCAWLKKHNIVYG